MPYEVWGVSPSPGGTKGASEMWGTGAVWPWGAAAMGAGGPGTAGRGHDWGSPHSQEVKEGPRSKQDFPGGLDSKASAYNAGDPGSIPGSGRSPGEGNGNPLQCSCLENPIDGGTW